MCILCWQPATRPSVWIVAPGRLHWWKLILSLWVVTASSGWEMGACVYFSSLGPHCLPCAGAGSAATVSVNLEGRDLETSHLGMNVPKSVCTLLSCGSLSLFPSATGSFCDGGWTRHWPVSRAACLKGSLLCSFSRTLYWVFLYVHGLCSLRSLLAWAGLGMGSILWNRS